MQVGDVNTRAGGEFGEVVVVQPSLIHILPHELLPGEIVVVSVEQLHTFDNFCVFW
jgi:hypothetical protein